MTQKSKKIISGIILFLIIVIGITSYFYFQKSPEEKAVQDYKKEIGVIEGIKLYEKLKGDKVIIDKVKKVDYDNKYLILKKKSYPFSIVKGLNSKINGKNIALFLTSENKPYKIKELANTKMLYKNMNYTFLKGKIQNSENRFIKVKGLEESYLKKEDVLPFLEKFLSKRKLENKKYTTTLLKKEGKPKELGPIKKDKDLWVIYYQLKNKKYYIASIIITPYYNKKDKELYQKYYQNNSILRDNRLKKDLFSSYHKIEPLIFY